MSEDSQVHRTWTGARPDDPLFSVVIPAYNARASIADAIESCLTNRVPIEVLVVEDGSPDPIHETDLPRGPVCLFTRARNGGTARARNRAILAARGRWIAFLDADDAYEPGRLDAAAEELSHRSGLDGLVTDAVIISPDGSSRVSRPTVNSDGLLHLRTSAIGAAHILSRFLFESIGLFDPHWRVNEDSDLWLRMILSGARIGYLPRPAYLYRLHQGAKTSRLDAVEGLHEFRDIHFVNAIRPRVPLKARGILLARALKWEREALKAAWARSSRAGKTNRDG